MRVDVLSGPQVLTTSPPEYLFVVLCSSILSVPADPAPCGERQLGGLSLKPVRRIHDVRRRIRYDTGVSSWSAAAVPGPVIITELSNRSKAGLAAGASK